MRWYDLISHCMLWHDMISDFYGIISYYSIWDQVIWYHRIWYHTISFDIISCHMIWYHIISAAASRCNADRIFFQELYPGKMTFEKTKILNRSARKFCTFSLLNHYKIFFSRTSFDYFLFSRKIVFCERARNSCEHPPFCCRVVNLEHSNTVKTQTKWVVIFVPMPSLRSTGP